MHSHIKPEMEYEKQVDKAHYEFLRYMSKERWASIWHQLDEIQQLEPESVLEIGPGPGVFKSLVANLGVNIETLDIDPELKPDHVSSVTAMPLGSSSYDVVCAFQVLEHLPYEVSLNAFKEMVRVSRRNVVISLPDARAVWRYEFHVPKLGPLKFLMPRPKLRAPVHEFDGEHYWEINKLGYSLTRVIADFSRHARLVKTYRVLENPSHRFFVFGREELAGPSYVSQRILEDSNAT